MSTTVAQEQLDKAKAEELIATVQLMPEVERIDVELYTDHTGDPSFQLTFRLKPDVKVDIPFIHRFHDFSAIVQTKILHSDLNRFPYTRLGRVA